MVTILSALARQISFKKSLTRRRRLLALTYASPPAFHAESVDAKDPNAMSVSSKPTTSLVSPPTSLADEMDVTQDGEALTSVESEAPTLHTPNSSSRHSSRQPRHAERFAPETTLSRPSKPAPRPAPTAMRRTTPGPLMPSTKKPSSRPSSSHTKKSSPMVEKRFERHMASSLSPNQTSKHMKGLIDEENTDAESPSSDPRASRRGIWAKETLYSWLEARPRAKHGGFLILFFFFNFFFHQHGLFRISYRTGTGESEFIMRSRRPFCFRASAAVEFVILYVHGSFLPLNLGLVFSCLPKSQWTFYFLLSYSAQSCPKFWTNFPLSFALEFYLSEWYNFSHRMSKHNSNLIVFGIFLLCSARS